MHIIFSAMTTRIKSGLRISSQGMVFDPSTGESFIINPTGLALLTLLMVGAEPEEIYNKLSLDYQVSPTEFERYLLDFLSVLKSLELLENDS
jgi:hypothetical protein